MAKDPAMLWYWNDWYSGTSLLTRFLKGCYMDLLHAQFNNGRLSLEQIKICLGADFATSWFTLIKKFKQDENGLFFNERIERETQKREAFSESRRANVNKRYQKPTREPTYVEDLKIHKENRNENINEFVLKKEKQNEFLKDQAWKEQFCMAKNISMEELELLQRNFITETNLKNDEVDNYKRYFTNSFNKGANNTTPKMKKEFIS